MKIAALLALACALQGDAKAPPATDPLATLSPLRPIAGLAGFQSSSALTYASDASKPHSLEATYVFPDRARWYVAPLSGGSQRQVIYRCADQYFSLEAGRGESVRIDRVANAEDWRSSCGARCSCGPTASIGAERTSAARPKPPAVRSRRRWARTDGRPRCSRRTARPAASATRP